ncbi:MAG: hypothetical protein HY652_11645 [Acidobacteria bacterium]|nr:hypothetical protein [Acidobacteriota bacterium]
MESKKATSLETPPHLESAVRMAGFFLLNEAKRNGLQDYSVEDQARIVEGIRIVQDLIRDELQRQLTGQESEKETGDLAFRCMAEILSRPTDKPET